MTLAWVLSILLAQQAGGDLESYRKQIEAWRAERVAKLKADGGWLTVAGLFWLAPGRNRFGAAPGNEIVLPPSAPAHAGAFVLEAGHVRVEVEPGVTITLGGKPVTRAALRSDAGGAEPDVLALGPLTMQVIDRGGRLGVRLKDMQSAARRSFKGTSWYPIDPAYRVTARFEARAKPLVMKIPTVLGTVEPMPSPGTAVFELRGKTWRLDPVLEPGETQLFFIIRDATTGHATYGGGRFLYADPPQDGRVVLDFNKAYSPPCAFTAYATCPLPPPGNRLGVAVEAGELAPPH
jgi:uncharacterized protein (DUF1684 family)